MKKLIVILAITLCAAIAGAQSNPLFAPFQDSLRLAVPLAIQPRAPASVYVPPTAAPGAQVQYFIGANGRTTVAIPLDSSGAMYYIFEVEGK